MTTASVCTWRKVVYQSSPQIPFGDRCITGPLEASPCLSLPSGPQEGLKSLVGLFGWDTGHPRSFTLNLTFLLQLNTLRHKCGVQPASSACHLSSVWSIEVCAHFPRARCCTHLGQLYSSFLSFLFFFSQSLWVTATWNCEENGINMLEMLESDLQLFILLSLTSWAYF